MAEKDATRYDKEMAKCKPSAKFTAELEACKKNPKYQPRLKKVCRYIAFLPVHCWASFDRSAPACIRLVNSCVQDPAAPTKPASGYLYFTSDVREKLGKQKAHKNKSMTELSMVMGKMWSEMSDKNKAPYIQEADDDKARYEAEMKKYKPTPAWLEAKAYLEAKKAKAKKDKGR